MNTNDQKWATYFDELGIKYLYKPTNFQNNNYTPTFYLPDYICFAQVIVGPYTQKEIDNITTLAKQQLFSLLSLHKKPSLDWFELVHPVKNGAKWVAELVNVVQDPHNEKPQFLSNPPLQGKGAFKNNGLNQAIKAVKIANS